MQMHFGIQRSHLMWLEQYEANADSLAMLRGGSNCNRDLPGIADRLKDVKAMIVNVDRQVMRQRAVVTRDGQLGEHNDFGTIGNSQFNESHMGDYIALDVAIDRSHLRDTEFHKDVISVERAKLV
jgi:hypothetical protein